jgi:uncharacterized membrane protein (GlpM family)
VSRWNPTGFWYLLLVLGNINHYLFKCPVVGLMEWLSKHEVLSSNASTTKKKKAPFTLPLFPIFKLTTHWILGNIPLLEQNHP